jgi:hypothetical protein
MKHKQRVGALVLLAWLAAAVAYAQGSGYDLSWWTVDGGGGGGTTGRNYTLSGTAGQADAGTLTGGGYTLGGGFWRGGASLSPPRPWVYVPLVRR